MADDNDQNNKSELRGPWYLHFKYWKETALNYIYAYNLIPADAPHHLEFKTYVHQSIYRLIYESNLLEGEGLSKGETRKIAEEYFPHLPSRYDAIKDMMDVCRDPFDMVLNKSCISKIDDICKQHNDLIPTISFKNKPRAFLEVIQHYTTYLKAENKALRYLTAFLNNYIRAFASHIFKLQYNKSPSADELNAFMSKCESISTLSKEVGLNLKSISSTIKELSLTIEPTYMFSEAGIKSLHQLLAKGLIEKSAGVPAGEYRIDNRIVGDLDVIFPAPELIPQCMQHFISRANSLVNSLWENPGNLFEVAAAVSHEFVRIHPFPDFNGRLSRLLLTVVLNTFGVPFPVTLRGDKKGRHRYLTSLRKANKGHFKPYIALIAKRVSESFMEVDQNLSLAGLPSILTFSNHK